MYDPKAGVFTYGDEEVGTIGLLQKESAYYLKFNSGKALYAIQKLKTDYTGTSTEDKCFYYHIYIDLLFEAVGLIHNRFHPSRNKPSRNLLKIQQMNCEQYEYTPANFPLLNDKTVRNFIEHIDEKDERLVNEHSYFGTFNLIFPDMDEKLRAALLKSDRPQNNLLNVENMTYTILTMENGKVIKKCISIGDLEKEILKINELSSKFWDYLTAPL